MSYNIGDIVYVVSGIPKTGREPEYFVETKKVFNVGKYVTIGVKEGLTYNHRFVPTDNTFCDSYSLSKGQKKNVSCYHYFSFGKNEATHIVFKSRKAAENFLYSLTGYVNYTYSDPFEYPVCERSIEERSLRSEEYGL